MKANALKPGRTLRTVLMAAFILAAVVLLVPRPATAGLVIQATIRADCSVPRTANVSPPLGECRRMRADGGRYLRNGAKHQRRIVRYGSLARPHRSRHHVRQVWIAGHWEQVSPRTARWVSGHWERV